LADFRQLPCRDASRAAVAAFIEAVVGGHPVDPVKRLLRVGNAVETALTYWNEIPTRQKFETV